MSKIVNTRLPEEQFRLLEAIASEEKLDRSSLVRKWISEKMIEHRMRKYSDFYHRGIMSLAEAASSMSISIYEMMDYLDRYRITGPIETLSEVQTEHTESMRILSRKLRKSD